MYWSLNHLGSVASSSGARSTPDDSPSSLYTAASDRMSRQLKLSRTITSRLTVRW